MEYYTNYSFSMVEIAEGVSNRRSDYTFKVEDGERWTEVLRNFTQFLSGVYGYDITSQVAIIDRADETTTVLTDYQ